MADRAPDRPRPRRRREHESAPRLQANRVAVNNYNFCNCRWGVGALVLVCAVCIFLPLLFYVVSRVLCQRNGLSPLGKRWVEEGTVRNFSRVFDVMTSNSLGEIEALPAIIYAAMDNIKDTEGKLEDFRFGGAGEILLQNDIVNKTFEVLHLYREATESIYEFVLCGRNLMRDMVNSIVDDIQKAFDEEKYNIIRMHLGDVEKHLNEAKEKLETAQVKLKTAVSTTDALLGFIMSKVMEKKTIAEDVEQRWPAGYARIIIALGTTLGASLTVLTPIPLVAGATAGAGLAGFYYFREELNRQNLLQRLDSEVTVLSAAGGKVSNVSDILRHCVLRIIELKSAVGEAQKSTGRMNGHLMPEDAELFRIRLRDAKVKYQNLLTLYEQIAQGILSGNIKPK